jgi:hypothetical protein
VGADGPDVASGVVTVAPIHFEPLSDISGGRALSIGSRPVLRESVWDTHRVAEARSRQAVGLRNPDLVHSGRRGAVFDAVHSGFVDHPWRSTITVSNTRGRPIRLALADRALHLLLGASSCGGWVINRRCRRRRR